MSDKPRCQSCGMPLGHPEGYGTRADGSRESEYCKFCFQGGVYTLPDLTLEGMIQRSVDFMTAQLGFARAEAERLSRQVIPALKRWKRP